MHGPMNVNIHDVVANIAVVFWKNRPEDGKCNVRRKV